MKLFEAVRLLVRSFSDQGGMSFGAFFATEALINSLYGIEATKPFLKRCKGVCGRYSFINIDEADLCLKEIQKGFLLIK